MALRKELAELGVDHGPATIQWHLGRRGLGRCRRRRRSGGCWCGGGSWCPSPASGRSHSFRRFEATAPNELWQADCIDWVIATGTVKVLSFLDDHSRVALRVKALPEATSEATWATFSEASAAWGVPLGQLSDNGLNFSGRLRGFEVYFETQLRAIGVVAKTSRPYHPQTCGKVERFQQTLKKWLRRQPLAADLAELQAQLDAFVDYYNHHRPHRGIGRRTPIEAWAATPPAINLGIALPSPAHATDRRRRRPRRRQRRPLPHRRRRRMARPHRPRPPRRHPRRRVHRPPPRPSTPTRPHPPLPALRTPPRRHPRPAYPDLSGMSRDTRVRHVARHNIARL